MTTDEKLAALQKTYPNWRIQLNNMHVLKPVQFGPFEGAHSHASALCQEEGANGAGAQTHVSRLRANPKAALDALAEALAKQEGKCPKCGGGMACSTPVCVDDEFDATLGALR